MKIEKLRKIVGYNREHLDEMYLLSRHFSGNNGINDEPYINFVQMIRQALLNKKTILLYFPLKDMKIKALAMKSDYYKYIVINSNYSSSETNFALAHEIYHLFYGEQSSFGHIELSDSYEHEYQEEMAASLFAGMILMPETDFVNKYKLFYEQSKDIGEVLVKLMSYYSVPYMSVLIRCLELKLFRNNEDVSKLIDISENDIRNLFRKLWLDEGILNTDKRNDINNLTQLITLNGDGYVKEGYLTNGDVEKSLKNIMAQYDELTGEVYE